MDTFFAYISLKFMAQCSLNSGNFSQFKKGKYFTEQGNLDIHEQVICRLNKILMHMDMFCKIDQVLIFRT